MTTNGKVTNTHTITLSIFRACFFCVLNPLLRLKSNFRRREILFYVMYNEDISRDNFDYNEILLFLLFYILENDQFSTWGLK